MTENTTGAPRAPVAPSPRCSSGTGIENRDRAPVLRPAGDIIADCDRALLAVGNRAHALPLHAARNQIIARRLRATGTERDVVFARAALVGMPFDQEGVLRIGPQPLRLFLERRDGLGCELGRIRLEEDAVSNIDHEILLAARHRGARIGGTWVVDGILRARAECEPRNKKDAETQRACIALHV